MASEGTGKAEGLEEEETPELSKEGALVEAIVPESCDIRVGDEKNWLIEYEIEPEEMIASEKNLLSPHITKTTDEEGKMVNEADPYIFFYDGEIDGMKLHLIVENEVFIWFD